MAFISAEIAQNKVLVVPALSWIIAQLLKFFINIIRHRDVDFEKLTTAGGMPSSHSAMVTSLTLETGFAAGFGSPVFALSAIVALIVMYDAAGVRRAAGTQAAILNKVVREVYKDRRIPHDKLKEILGHTPVEVLAGAGLGTVLAVFF